MSEIANSNFQIMGRMLASLEVLRKKGYFNDQEAKEELKIIDAANQARAKQQLEAERARLVAEKEALRDQNPGSPQGGSLQPKDTGIVEDSSGKPKLTLLDKPSDGGNPDGTINTPDKGE
jgi:hypothetical protein